jgi:hypothetical protein
MIRVALVMLAGLRLAHGQEGAPSLTGIPIEALFACIGALVALVYWDLRRSLGKNERAVAHLSRASVRRDARLARVQIFVSQICAKLDIHVPPAEDTARDEEETQS